MSKQEKSTALQYFDESPGSLKKGAFLINSQGTIEKINGAFTKILGYEQKDIIGKSVVDLRHDLSQGSDS